MGRPCSLLTNILVRFQSGPRYPVQDDETKIATTGKESRTTNAVPARTVRPAKVPRILYARLNALMPVINILHFYCM